MTVQVDVHTSMSAISEEWDELADRAHVEPFLRPGWIGAWWEAFGSGRLAIAAARDGGGRLQAVLAYQVARGGIRFPVNWHTPVFGATAADAAAARAVYAHVLADRPLYANLRFLDEDDGAAVAVDALRAAGYRTSVRTVLPSPYLPLRGGWDALRRPRENEMVRRWRKLDKLGHAELDVQDGSVRLRELLDEGYAIEGSGWKTEQGTAILSRPETKLFYDRVAEWAAARGILRLMFLRAGGRAVAFHYGLEDVGRYYFVKGGYDTDVRTYAPGLLIMRSIVHWACDRGLDAFEFLGAPDAEKTAWTDLVRRRVAVEAFAPTLGGRALESAYVRGRPLAKRAVGVVRSAAARGARRAR